MAAALLFGSHRQEGSASFASNSAACGMMAASLRVVGGATVHGRTQQAGAALGGQPAGKGE